MKKEKKTAAEISQMVQDAIDPKGERKAAHVGPKPAHGASWMVITDSADGPAYLAEAQRKALELSALYDMIEDED